MCGILLQLMFSNYCISHLPTRARGLFPGGPMKQWQTSEHVLFPPRVSPCSIPPRSTENPLYAEGGGGERRFLSQDLNPGSDSAALRETKAGEDLTETWGERAKDRAPSCPPGWTLLGQPEVQHPEETALGINFKPSPPSPSSHFVTRGLLLVIKRFLSPSLENSWIDCSISAVMACYIFVPDPQYRACSVWEAV